MAAGFSFFLILNFWFAAKIVLKMAGGHYEILNEIHLVGKDT